jgi:predicted Zn-dependent protease
LNKYLDESSAVRLATIVLLCLASWSMPAMAQDHSSESNRERAVTLARRGDLEQALAILDRLHCAAPDNVAVAQDYVVVLGWAGRDAEAIDIFRSLPRETPCVKQRVAGCRLRRRCARQSCMGCD